MKVNHRRTPLQLGEELIRSGYTRSKRIDLHSRSCWLPLGICAWAPGHAKCTKLPSDIQMVKKKSSYFPPCRDDKRCSYKRPLRNRLFIAADASMPPAGLSWPQQHPPAINHPEQQISALRHEPTPMKSLEIDMSKSTARICPKLLPNKENTSCLWHRTASASIAQAPGAASTRAPPCPRQDVPCSPSLQAGHGAAATTPVGSDVPAVFLCPPETPPQQGAAPPQKGSLPPPFPSLGAADALTPWLQAVTSANYIFTYFYVLYFADYIFAERKLIFGYQESNK